MKDRAKKSAKDAADEILRGIRNEMVTHSNLGAWLLLLAHAERGVQRRVLDALGTRLPGRPPRPMPDEEWLATVEAWREHVEACQKHIKPDATELDELEVIENLLTNTDTRHGRAEGEQFHPQRQEGKAEIKRIRDACVRARSNRNNPFN